KLMSFGSLFFFFQAEDGIRAFHVTGVQTCALPIYTDTFDEKDSSVIAHIDLADWADLIIVAPGTANVIGKLAGGIGDDMVTTTLLAATAPIWIAPAMNVHMYDHPAVKRNIQQLHEDGIRFIEPSEGFLACGYVGKG